MEKLEFTSDYWKNDPNVYCLEDEDYLHPEKLLCEQCKKTKRTQFFDVVAMFDNINVYKRICLKCTNNDKYTCFYCDKQVNNSHQNRHIVSKNHIKNQEKYENEQFKIKKLWNCDICNKTIKEKYKNKHLNSNDHIVNKKIKESNYIDSEIDMSYTQYDKRINKI